MTLFRLDASIRTDGSVTRAVADTVTAAWSAEHPGTRLIRRDIGTAPLPADAWRTAVSNKWTPAEDRSPVQRSADALVTGLADELVAADADVFAVPMNNYGVPQHFKAWADLVLIDERMLPPTREPSAIAGRPAVLVLARGGGYAPGSPREGWDHASPWIKRFLGDVLRLEVEVVEVVEAELTLAPVTPAMADLRDLAAAALRATHEAATARGAELARKLGDTAAA